MSEHGDKGVRIVEDIAAGMKGWDRGPMSLAHELRECLKAIADEGTAIDSGGGDGIGDLWVTVQGVEYYIAFRRSNKQLLSEGKPIPE